MYNQESILPTLKERDRKKKKGENTKATLEMTFEMLLESHHFSMASPKDSFRGESSGNIKTPVTRPFLSIISWRLCNVLTL